VADKPKEAPQEAVHQEETRLLDPREVTVRRDDFDRLNLRVGTEEHPNIHVRRAFPLTAPEGYLVFLDAEEQEIGILPDLQGMDRDSRRVIEEELELTYFTPRVLRILSAQSRHGVTAWELDTDRGLRKIYVRDRTDIRHITPTKVVFVDMHGVKYEIPDVRRLDDASLRRLEAES